MFLNECGINRMRDCLPGWSEGILLVPPDRQSWPEVTIMGGNSAKARSSQLSFKYEPTRKDLSMHLAAGNGFSRVSHFLGVMPGFYFVHGNSEISILDQNGKNVAQQYTTFRQIRSWNLALGIGYSAVAGSKWEIDTQDAGPSWEDVPGAKYPESPPEWKERRELLEFFVEVDKHPEIGTLYCFVIVSLKPNQYRVEMSSALCSPPTEDPSAPLKNSPTPWAEESHCRIVLDTGWLTVPAAGRR